MKILTLIIAADVKQVLADTLRGLGQVRGFTFSHVEGHGAADGNDLKLSARDHVIGYVPRVRADIMLEDKDVADVLAILRNSQSGLGGHSRYWIIDVESQGQL